MSYLCVVLLACLSLPRGQADPRTSTRRYKPVIQVTEEIDINDITFTTSSPEFERSSHKATYYNEGGAAKGGHARLADTSPSVFPHLSYKDGYGVEKIYTTGQPKYKPYKVIKVKDGYRPVVYKPKGHERLPQFDSYGGTEATKQFLAKVVPFSSQLPAKSPTRASTFDNKNFIPSPTFSPTVLPHLNDNSNHQPTQNWLKPTKKPYHIKKPKNIPDNHRGAEEFVTTSEKLEENLSPSTLYKESPQQSESFLAEISTLNKGGNGGNLDEVADSLDLKTGERVEFQMYGMDGPQSYKFGFDTGKGHNRHFRFEERDNTGKVKGHYGYLDEDGKMRIMKYEADPITGFHAGPVEIPDEN